MHLSPDEVIYWQHGPVKLNATIITTWGLMATLTLGSWIITRRLTTGIHISRWQSMIEVIVSGIEHQIQEIGLQQARRYIGFVGTLFLFIGFANLCTILPGYEPPTGSLSTTAALAIAVFLAVPVYSIAYTGLGSYLRTYVHPTPLLLPFNIVSELSRTLALAVRLFGNIMSGSTILAILLSIAPFVFPVLMSLLGLLAGTVQAYIFSVLATVYIAAATRTHEE